MPYKIYRKVYMQTHVIAKVTLIIVSVLDAKYSTSRIEGSISKFITH